MYEEYCSAFCNPGFEILGLLDEYITCNIATGWQWSHVLNGNDQPICTCKYLSRLFRTPFLFLNYRSKFEESCIQNRKSNKFVIDLLFFLSQQ